jgi:nucleotide-binding universal stress UspA family protein
LTRNVIALATADTEFGHVPADTAKEEAKTIANEEGKAVTLRHPVTDEVLGKVKPSPKKPAKAKAPGQAQGSQADQGQGQGQEASRQSQAGQGLQAQITAGHGG